MPSRPSIACKNRDIAICQLECSAHNLQCVLRSRGMKYHVGGADTDARSSRLLLFGYCGASSKTRFPKLSTLSFSSSDHEVCCLGSCGGRCNPSARRLLASYQYPRDFNHRYKTSNVEAYIFGTDWFRISWMSSDRSWMVKHRFGVMFIDL